MFLHFIWPLICIFWCLYQLPRLLEARRTGILRLPLVIEVRRSDDDIFWFRYWVLTAWSGLIGLLMISMFLVVQFLWHYLPDRLSAWSLDGLN